MSFPRYPKYKDSGVEWLGEVPEHWKVAPLKTVASHNDDVLPEDTPPEYEINYVDISGVEASVGITTRETMPFSEAPSRARRRVRHGDVIVSTVRTYLRAIARVVEPESNLVVSTGFAAIRPREALYAGFAGYMLSGNHFIEQVIARSTGVSYPAINASELVGIPALLPPPNEQSVIATFLDRETAKIDALIAEQQRLIELLQEKRQAVISHAVTKGLNPDALMKDSGIEWLGEVPEHWGVRKLRTLAAVVRGSAPRPAGDPTLFDGDFMPWVTVAEITKDESKWLMETNTFLTELGASSSRCFEPHTLLYSNSGATLGVPKILGIRACANDGVIGFLDLCDDADISFLYFFLYSITEAIREKVKQGSGQPNLNTDIVKDLAVALPSTSEQLAIVRFVDDACFHFDVLSSDAARAIPLLQERRSALISAAVTGQIDVRNYASEGAAA